MVILDEDDFHIWYFHQFYLMGFLEKHFIVQEVFDKEIPSLHSFLYLQQICYEWL